MQTARKLLSLVLTLGLIVHVFTLGLLVTARSVDAALLSTAKDTLSDPRTGTSSTHTLTFTHATASTIHEIRVQFATTPTGNTKPTGLTLTGATLGTLVNLNAGWTLNTSNAASGLLLLQHTNSGEAVNAATAMTIPLQAITNSGIDDCDGGSVASSDTCYVRIQTATATGAWDTNVVDSTTVTYTVIQQITVSATVDPTFTFVITPVNNNTAVGGVTTSVSSTVTTLPFGNLTAGTPKYAAHRLNVTTNANGGYTVTMRMVDQMTGTYGANNIDPYAATGATWSTPTVWTEPTGSTPNTDTGWIGANTTDADVSGFASALFGPVNSTNNTVMSSTSSDNGSVAAHVVYAIEANVYQPADVYTGHLVYTATPTYQY